MRRCGVIVLGAFVALAVAAAAIAAGGPTIAGAPFAVSGQQLFGNTANMPDQSGRRNEYWRLQIVAGDSITVNFSQGSSTMDLHARLYDVSANDFNIDQVNSLADVHPQANGKGQINHTAQRSGTYVLRFQTRSSRAGTFDFVAYVRHAVRVFIAPRATVARTGLISIQIRNPEGAPISDKGLRVTLRGTWGGKTQTLGVTSPSGGVARFKLNLPASLKGSTIKIRAIAQGANYVGALSVTRSMRVR